MNRLYNYKNAFRILKGGKISLVVSALLTTATLVHASPSGGSVTSGNANISQNGNITNINQSSEKASIKWQKFDVSKNEIVNFNQPSTNSVTLNKVVGATNSVIEGAVNAKGQVILVNPNGVVFNEGSEVNVGGIVATTKNIKDEDFQNGNYKFEGDSQASIINKGNIKAKYVAMVGKEVINEGRITATLGRVELAGANKFTLNINGDSLLKLTIDEGTLNALVKNKGIIKADGGVVYMTTQALDKVLDGMVNNSGVIEAQSLSTNEKGEVVLFAHGGTAEIGGEIKAEGGFVETSGAKVDLKDDIKIKAKKWLIDPYDIEIVSDSATETNITPSSGTYTAPSNSTKIKASTIQTALNGGTDVTVTTAGAGTQNGDITVNSAISWTSNSDLTLRADRNININQDITATGSSAKLTLEYRQTIDSLIPGDYYIAKDKKITLQDGQNFSTKDHNNQVVNYTVINSKEALQNINLNSTNLSGNWALGSDVNLSGENWTPIGFSADSRFSGKFDGLGHNISNLSISNYANRYIGLFGIINSATIQNLKITNATVSNNLDYGGTGILLGYQALAGGRINNIYIEGGSVLSSHANGGSIGSVIGQYLGSELKNIYSTAYVTATNDAFVGGIAGTILATKSERLYYKGNITVLGAQHTGYDQGATQYAGIGGLFGQVGTDNEIKNSGVEASITAQHLNDNSALGGFVGRLGSSTVDNSYSAVIFDEIGTAFLTNKGSFIGKATDISGANNFYDSTLSSWNNGIGTGKTTTEMKTISTFDMTNSADWDITTDPSISDKYPQLRWATDGLGNGNTVWVIGGSGETVLSYTLSPLTGNYVYKGSDYNLSDLWSASSIFGSTYSDWIYGTDYSFIYGGNSVTGFTNAGTYNNISIDILKSGFTEATSGNTVGSFTITPKTLTLSASKVYDGNANLTGSHITLGGLVGSETLTYTDATANSKNVADNAINYISAITLANGTGGLASNYQLPTLNLANAPATITAKGVIVNAGVASTKAYDGTTNAIINGAMIVGMMPGDNIAVNTGTFADSNAGTKAVTPILSGDDASNYFISFMPPVLGTILRKTLTINGADNWIFANDKAYDGNTDAIVDILFGSNWASLNGLVGDETIEVTALGTFDGVNAGWNKDLDVSFNLVNGTNGGLASNYEIANITKQANILKKDITVTGDFSANNKVYDGNKTATFATNNIVLDGVVEGEDLILSGLGLEFINKNVGNGKTVKLIGGVISSTQTGNKNNYNFTLGEVPPTTTANITKKLLLVNGTTVDNKMYDGTTTATVNLGTLSGLIENETLNLNGVGTFDSVNAGNRVVTVNYSLGDGTGLASNYELNNNSIHNSTINKANLTYTTTGGTKTYGQSFTLPTPTFVGGTPTGNATVKVFDSNNNDVTAQAIDGTLAVGTYTVKTILTDTNYDIASSGNTNGVLTIAANNSGDNGNGGGSDNGNGGNSDNVNGGDSENPTPPTPNNEEKEVIEQKVNDIITTIVNSAVKNNIPIATLVQPKAEVQNGFDKRVNSSIINNTPTLDNNKSLGKVNLGLNEVIRSVKPSVNEVAKDTKLTIVGETAGEAKIATVELADLIAKSGGGELRVALSPDSFVELVNGGVTLPNGVSQEFYVVEDKK